MSDEVVQSATPDAGATDGQPAAEGQPQGESQATQESAAAPTESEVAESEKPGVEYQPFALPEGIEIDEALLKQATESFKEAGISQEHAQKLIDLYAAQTAAVQERTLAQAQEWAEATKTDPELGGADFSAKVAVAHKAVRQFGSEALVALFEQSGMGNHPELVRFAYRVGKAIGEGPLVHPGSNAGPTEQDVLSSLYPTMFPKSE